MPAQDIGRDFITDAVSNNAGMIASPTGRSMHRRARFATSICAVEKAEMLAPRNINQHIEALLVENI